MTPLTDPETGETVDTWSIGYHYGVRGETFERAESHFGKSPLTPSEWLLLCEGWSKGNDDLYYSQLPEEDSAC
jgi:hypothetical protein